MHPLLSSKLTHREILSLTGVKMTIKAISLARRGYRPLALAELEETLKTLDSDRIRTAIHDMKLLDSVDTMITAAKYVLSLPVYNIKVVEGQDRRSINIPYLKAYKSYIDLKVLYNKVISGDDARLPRNHAELTRLHQLVRDQHDEITPVPGVRKGIRTKDKVPVLP